MTRTWNNDERTGSWGEYCRSQMRTLETDLAAAGHGGSTAGAAVVRAFAFTFASSGLSNGTGHVVYTPTVGDRWLDGWIEVDSAFDGTTPLADFNQLAGSTFGLLGDAIGGCNMSIVDTPPGVTARAETRRRKAMS